MYGYGGGIGIERKECRCSKALVPPCAEDGNAYEGMGIMWVVVAEIDNAYSCALFVADHEPQLPLGMNVG